MKDRVKYTLLILAFMVLPTMDAHSRCSLSIDSISPASHADSVKASLPGSESDYTTAYETALKRKELLEYRKQHLMDSINEWNKELKRLEAHGTSIVKSNGKMKTKINEAKTTVQKNGIYSLMERKQQLEQSITAKKNEKALLQAQLQLLQEKLDTTNRQREHLEKIQDDVTEHIIAENKDYVEKSFSEMSLSELKSIRLKCQEHISVERVNELVTKIDNAIMNKELYDNMVQVVNAAYKKPDVEKALTSVSQIKEVNQLQQKEISELKAQLTLFADGLSTFKEFITTLNDKRKGVNNYSYEYFQDDQVLSINNLSQRIETQVKRVPYLNRKFEAFMKAFQAAPNKHSPIEAEILVQ